MHGIVSLLDNIHYQLVEDLWAELKREFALEGVYITPYPHFSYQVTQHYNVEQIEPILRHFASNHAPFQVRTTGLGIFTGASPVVYIPVVRSPELTQFHQALWRELSNVGDGIQDYYHPGWWMPHITIGFGDMNSDRLPEVVRHLSERDFNWEITVDNIALIYDTGTKQELRERFELSGSSGAKRKGPVTRETLEAFRQIREQIMQDRQGKPFEDSTELIRQMREERTRELEQL